MPSPFIITTAARLHFGPFSFGAANPPFFGGVGLMVDSPGFRVEFREEERDVFEGPPEHVSRAQTFLARCRKRLDGHANSTGVHITIHKAIPTHAGFGSGTQLGLAIARGFTVLISSETQHAECLAKLVDRGRRSAIGVHGFDLGGFLIDAGKNSQHELGSLAAHSPMPDEWRFVLITPTDDAGLYGDDETTAFAQLPPMPSATTERLRHIGTVHLFSAVRHADFTRFSESLFEFGNIVGEYFAPVQGDVFRHPLMRELVATLRNAGVNGIAQTSWGPTICVAAENDSDAKQLLTEIEETSLCRECSIRIARPRNTGAAIS